MLYLKKTTTILLLLSLSSSLAILVQIARASDPNLDLDLDLNSLQDDVTAGVEANEALATNDDKEARSSMKEQSYTSPRLRMDDTYLLETFDDEASFKSNWIQSADPKYNEGRWQQSSGPDRPHADLQLVLPQKARHYAISSKLAQPFKFSDDKPLVVQYEVQFREGLDCGGAYVKLLRHSAINDLNKLTDKTPFTIMFGPDKCGSESKLHFIIQYLNPKTQEYSEKHWKQAKFVSNLLPAFSDKEHHLFKLVLEPSNNFEIFMDGKSVGKGNLLEDLDPAINPPKEIVDVNDKMPEDWDERPQIEDPEAKKPDDWDEDAPKQIEDPNATKPSDWLEDEPSLVSDPEAKKPEDWDDKIDGDWEAPKVDNPKCKQVSGCGKWSAPMIANPQYKGKWRPPKIDNPNYKGKWAPRMIPNPDYFFDENPFKSLDPIGAVAFELWSMADNMAFDNLVITSNHETAKTLQHLTWQEKKHQADASSPSLMTRSMHYLKVNPWLWAVIVLAIALPLFLFISYCCDTKKKSSSSEAGARKKTDKSKPDAPKSSGDEAELLGDEEEVVEGEDNEEEEEAESEEQEDDDEDDEVEVDEEDEGKTAGDDARASSSSKRQVRQRKK